MHTDSFWTLIEESRRQAHSGEKRDASLREALGRLPPPRIVCFQAHLEQLTDEAFTWNLWAAADRIFGGWCSDNAFRSFQHWMIGLGRAVFEAAVTDPDVLAYAPDVARLSGRRPADWSEEERPAWPALDGMGLQAYEAATGPSDDFGDAFYAAVRNALRLAAHLGWRPGALRAPTGTRDPSGRRWSARDEEEAARRLPMLSVMFPIAEGP